MVQSQGLFAPVRRVKTGNRGEYFVSTLEMQQQHLRHAAHDQQHRSSPKTRHRSRRSKRGRLPSSALVGPASDHRPSVPDIVVSGALRDVIQNDTPSSMGSSIATTPLVHDLSVESSSLESVESSAEPDDDVSTSEPDDDVVSASDSDDADDDDDGNDDDYETSSEPNSDEYNSPNETDSKSLEEARDNNNNNNNNSRADLFRRRK